MFIMSIIQSISEKCTGAFKFECLIIFWTIYLSKSCRKSGSLSINRIHTQKYSYYDLVYNKNKYM